MPELDPKKRVVITGIGAVTPAGNTAKETWKNFSTTNKSFISTITLGEENYKKTYYAGEVKGFDIYQYGAERQVKRADLFAHFGLASGIQAMLDSKRLEIESPASQKVRAKYILLDTDPDRIGVILGIAGGGTWAVEKAIQSLMENGFEDEDRPGIPMMNPARVSTDIAKLIHAKGGAFTINSACSSGSQAILEGYHKIVDGHLDVVVAGGAETPLHPAVTAAFTKINVLREYNPDIKPEHATSSLNKDTKGMVIAEGAAALVLERLSHALKRNAPIIAEVAGGHYFANPDEELDPTVTTISKLIGTALENSKVKPSQIDHSNHHAGGSKGDAKEIEGLEEVLKDHSRKITINGHKSRVGHSLGGAGAIESIIVAKEVQKGIATPIANLVNPIEGFNLVSIPTKKEIDAALKISLGLDGQFCSLVFKKFSY